MSEETTPNQDLRYLIEELNKNPNVQKTAREWSEMFEDKLPQPTRFQYITPPLKNTSLYAKTQNSLKILSHVGFVKVSEHKNGGRRIVKYEAIKPIEYHP
jgi:hypothetical protein